MAMPIKEYSFWELPCSALKNSNLAPYLNFVRGIKLMLYCPSVNFSSQILVASCFVFEISVFEAILINVASESCHQLFGLSISIYKAR